MKSNWIGFPERLRLVSHVVPFEGNFNSDHDSMWFSPYVLPTEPNCGGGYTCAGGRLWPETISSQDLRIHSFIYGSVCVTHVCSPPFNTHTHTHFSPFPFFSLLPFLFHSFSFTVFLCLISLPQSLSCPLLYVLSKQLPVSEQPPLLVKFRHDYSKTPWNFLFCLYFLVWWLALSDPSQNLTAILDRSSSLQSIIFRFLFSIKIALDPPTLCPFSLPVQQERYRGCRKQNREKAQLQCPQTHLQTTKPQFSLHLCLSGLLQLSVGLLRSVIVW